MDREQEVTGVPVPGAKVAWLAQRIETLKAKLGRLSAIDARMLASGETQFFLTDSDARAMYSQSHSDHGSGTRAEFSHDFVYTITRQGGGAWRQ